MFNQSIRDTGPKWWQCEQDLRTQGNKQLVAGHKLGAATVSNVVKKCILRVRPGCGTGCLAF